MFSLLVSFSFVSEVEVVVSEFCSVSRELVFGGGSWFISSVFSIIGGGGSKLSGKGEVSDSFISFSLFSLLPECTSCDLLSGLIGSGVSFTGASLRGVFLTFFAFGSFLTVEGWLTSFGRTGGGIFVGKVWIFEDLLIGGRIFGFTFFSGTLLFNIFFLLD